MKHILCYCLFFSVFLQAQYQVKGTMIPPVNSGSVTLYKTTGAHQTFIKKAGLTIDSLTIGGQKKAIGIFGFQLPENTPSGLYRLIYQQKEGGYIDFFITNEEVSFVFNPEYPEESLTFITSKENNYFTKYRNEMKVAQTTLDSLQIMTLKSPEESMTSKYYETLRKVSYIQNTYEKATQEMFIHPFVKASLQANPEKPFEDAKAYIYYLLTHYFKNINFREEALINSSFIFDRIYEYIFYVNFSEDNSDTNERYQKAINRVCNQPMDASFKKEVIEFLVGQFERLKNAPLINYLLEEHYVFLPDTLKNETFLSEKRALRFSE